MFIFESADDGSLWQLNSTTTGIYSDLFGFCQQLPGDTPSPLWQDVGLIPAVGSQDTNAFILPGFALNTYGPASASLPSNPALIMPIESLVLRYATDLSNERALGRLNCFQPVEIGCTTGNSTCLLKDTVAGTTLCAGAVTETPAEVAATNAFVVNSCETVSSSECSCKGNVNITNACKLVCTQPTSSYCPDAIAAYCNLHPAAKICLCTAHPESAGCNGGGGGGSSSGKPDQNKTGGLPNWAWGAIGGGAALIILIIVLVVVLRKRKGKPSQPPKPT